jgi:hypothetical protein
MPHGRQPKTGRFARSTTSGRPCRPTWKIVSTAFRPRSRPARALAMPLAQLCGPLQQCPPEQRHGLYHAERYVGGAAAGDSRGARPEVGCGPATMADSSPASRLTYRSRPVVRGSAGDGSVQSISPRVRTLNFRCNFSRFRVANRNCIGRLQIGPPKNGATLANG